LLERIKEHEKNLNFHSINYDLLVSTRQWWIRCNFFCFCFCFCLRAADGQALKPTPLLVWIFQLMDKYLKQFIGTVPIVQVSWAGGCLPCTTWSQGGNNISLTEINFLCTKKERKFIKKVFENKHRQSSIKKGSIHLLSWGANRAMTIHLLNDYLYTAPVNFHFLFIFIFLFQNHEMLFSWAR
jgi:hypothetical protein